MNDINIKDCSSNDNLKTLKDEINKLEKNNLNLQKRLEESEEMVKVLQDKLDPNSVENRLDRLEKKYEQLYQSVSRNEKNIVELKRLKLDRSLIRPVSQR